MFSDHVRTVPWDLSGADIRLLPDDIASPGLAFKINFDRFAPAGQSLFIDSDCFVTRDLAPVFEKFKGHPVGVIGINVRSGEWCGAEISNVLKQTGFKSLPRFNGGLYYIDMEHPQTRAIFASARAWAAQYEQLGFARLGQHLNDEPLIALALAEHGVQPVPDDGFIAADLNVAMGSRLDVTGDGPAFIGHPEGHPGHKWWCSSERFSPAIVHYGSGGYGRYLYLREAAKIYLKHTLKAPSWFVNGLFDPAIRMLYRLRSGPRGTTL